MHRPRSRRFLIPLLSIVGMMVLSFLVGAANMEFRLPPAGYLHAAFLGAEVFYAQKDILSPARGREMPIATIGNVDKPDKTFDGYTLYMRPALGSSSTRAFLINMKGEVVHQWYVAFS